MRGDECRQPFYYLNLIIPQKKSFMTESYDFVQTIFIRPCLDLSLRSHKGGANTLPLCYPAVHSKRGFQINAEKSEEMSIFAVFTMIMIVKMEYRVKLIYIDIYSVIYNIKIILILVRSLLQTNRVGRNF